MVVVDVAPLRVSDAGRLAEIRSALAAVAEQAGGRQMAAAERDDGSVPWNTMPLEEFLAAGAVAAAAPDDDGGDSSLDASPTSSGRTAADQDAHASAAASLVCSTSSLTAETSGADVALLDAAVVALAARVRQLKEQEGRSNSDTDVKQLVQELLEAKSRLRQAQAPAAAAAAPAVAAAAASVEPSPSTPACDLAPAAAQQPEPDAAAAASPPPSDALDAWSEALLADAFGRASIWQIPPQPLFFAAEREAAKRTAKALAALRADDLLPGSKGGPTASRASGIKAKASAKATRSVRPASERLVGSRLMTR